MNKYKRLYWQDSVLKINSKMRNLQIDKLCSIKKEDILRMFIFISILSSFSSCNEFNDDNPRHQIIVNLDKSVESSIYKICIQDSSDGNYKSIICQFVKSNNGYYNFQIKRANKKIRFLLHLNDSTQIVSNIIKLKLQTEKIEIRKENDKIIVAPLKIWRMLDIFYKIFRIYLLILLIKIPLTLLLLNPRQKILFIKYWSKIQTFYLIIIGLFFLIGLNYLFLIVTLFLDYYYLAIKYKDEKTKSNIIFIAFISNFLFLIFFLTLFLILTVLSS